MKIKPLLLKLFLIIVTSSFVNGQTNWASYAETMDVSKFQGAEFRLKASVRTDVADDSASARLWARVDKKNETGFFDNMWLRPIRVEDWNSYTINGIIDSGAVKISFGALCQYNGTFFYDDFSLEIKAGNNKWTTIFSEDFESRTHGFKKGVGKGNSGKNEKYSAEVVDDKKGKGTNCLLITGEGVPNFGVNDEAGKYATVNGIKLYYEIYGEGQPLLVLHGNGGSIGYATKHYADLIQHYKVIAVDSRAQGKSTDTNEPLTYEQMAADINALLEQLNIDSVLIWGHSDGGILGLILAMDYPKKVKKLLAFGANIHADSLSLFQFAFDRDKKVIRNSKDKTEIKLHQLMLEHPDIPYSELSRIKAPVLIMAGDRDVIRPEHTLKLFQNIPNSHLCILPGTTHGASWRKKELFLGLLYEFFDEPFRMPDTKSWYE